MTRKLSLTLFGLLFASAISFTGCGGGGEAEFTPSEAPTAEEEAEADAYEKAMMEAEQETASQR
ncbi:hypothetical protein Mal15_15980 [Stieleria maiorica]|uniref:Secreted protein n=1 Tax=Stieleria maiorica TaxID=2795974 RepID=A0A5B9M8S3_9BACT|nr:hypothetical protein [Stieleria maiorica]QEF97558.1 hypothetical protein Mal15_15980 [Stieleria maiorica]